MATLFTSVKHFVLERNSMVLARGCDSDATFGLIKEVYGNTAVKEHVHWKKICLLFLVSDLATLLASFVDRRYVL